MKNIFWVLILFIIFSCNTSNTELVEKEKTKTSISSNTDNSDMIRKTPEQWKKELNEQEYYVLREKGTERAGTGDLLNNKKKGIYTCRGCQLPLFHSDAKFNSGTGWPSYFQPIKKENVKEESDSSHGMVRTEILCGRCDGHLGHVFDDGPQPTGLRYCINSVSLDFVPQEGRKKN